MSRKLDHEPIVAFPQMSNLYYGTRNRYINLFNASTILVLS